jgi:tripartite-type tricarboxylate transporter receptor subunit TctC
MHDARRAQWALNEGSQHMMQRRHILGAVGLLAAPAAVRAQSWPTRPVSLLVPWAAGGGADTVTRIFAQGLERELGQPVNVVNRTGGNGITGHAAISNAPPDGYTIGTGTSEFVNFKVLGLADFGPENLDLLSRLATIPAGVTVPAQAPWRDFGAFAAALREARRGQITGSGVGAGGSWHLAAAGMCRALGLEADRIRWIPSNGGAPALQDLVAGGLGVFTGSPIEAQSLAAAGRVRVLAVMGETRLSTMPEVPTLREAGLAWAYANWFSLVAPRGIPAPVRSALLAAATRAHARTDVQEPMRARGIVPIWDGPEAFAAFAAGFGETSAVLLRDLGLARG